MTQPHPRIPEAVPPAPAIAEDHDPERDAGERCDGEAMDAARLNTFESLPSNRTADAELPFESLPSNRTADAELAISTTPQPSNPADQGPLPGASSPDSPNPLPSPEQIPTANFQWGEYDGPSLGHVIESAYAEAVHWQRNIFMIPSGKAGKDYVKEQARFFSAYADGTPLEQVALKATMIMPLLLLQKPHPTSKTKEHVRCLERRLRIWSSGNIEELVREGKIIQQHLPQGRSKLTNDNEKVARTFASLMMRGKLRAALRLVSDQGTACILRLEDEIDGKSVRDLLKEKHPAAQAACPATLLSPADNIADTHPVLFERIDGDLIRSTALRVQGSAGPSGMDAAGWRRMCTAFHGASKDLCNALAAFTRRICSTFTDPSGLAAFIACRLIPLNKNPGVRPIGICETARRIVGKAVLKVTKEDIQDAVGPLQLCAGHDAGCEAAIHAMRKIFDDEETEGVLLVDAKNAFNSLNRSAALHNCQVLCPSLAPILINIYRSNADLFVAEESIPSQEGVTQGDPLAMAMYALGTLPLIRAVTSPGANQTWYADDASAGGTLRHIRQWWDLFSAAGPDFGYFANSTKSWLMVKEQHLEEAKRIFAETGIHITCEGKRHLGAALGTRNFVVEYVREKAANWKAEIGRLSSFARSEPHAAYAALTHGLMSHWSFLLRSNEGIAHLLQPVEDAIRRQLLPAITGRDAISDHERDLLALPARLGGIGVKNPTTQTDEYNLSQRLSAPLTALIVQQSEDLGAAREQQQAVKKALRAERSSQQKSIATELKSSLPPQLQRAANLASEKGASSWLTTLPIDTHGFALHKGGFRDALCLRYNWTPPHLPTKCACGSNFTIEHALSCPTGGFTIIRHNEVRDLLANLLTEVCHDVSVEPHLQPLSGESFPHRTASTEDNARLDVAANGFWGGRFDKAFFDVRVFNPHAVSNRTPLIASSYRRHEQEKRRVYEQRVREIEHATFAPFVMASTGGLGPCATVTLKRLGALLSEKHSTPYGSVMGLLRCRLNFALLRSSVMCIRGSRSSRRRPGHIDITATDLVISEGNVPLY